MNILYVNGHPNDGSFHGAIQKTFIDNVSKNHELRVINLSREKFDPVLRFGYTKPMPENSFITYSKESVHWADHIVFAFPIWWGDAPALMKGWIERVFLPGDMYSMSGQNKKLLKEKTGDLIVTSRVPRLFYYFAGNGALRVFTKNLFLLTGIRKRHVIVLGGIDFIKRFDKPKRYDKFLLKIKRQAKSL